MLGDDEGMECEWANPRSLAEPRDDMPGAGWGASTVGATAEESWESGVRIRSTLR